MNVYYGGDWNPGHVSLQDVGCYGDEAVGRVVTDCGGRGRGNDQMAWAAPVTARLAHEGTVTDTYGRQVSRHFCTNKIFCKVLVG